MKDLTSGERTNRVPPILIRPSLYLDGWTDPTGEGAYSEKRDAIKFTFQGSGTSLYDPQPVSSDQLVYPKRDLVVSPLSRASAIGQRKEASTALPWRTYELTGWHRLGITTTPLEGLGIDDLNAFTEVVYFVDAANVSRSKRSEGEVAQLPLTRAVSTLWRAAEEEDFQDGYESQFSRDLSNLVHKHGARVLFVIEMHIQKDARDAYVSAEALKSIGRMDHDQSRTLRRLMLERILNHQFDIIREGAALGLEELDDRMAIPALSARLAVEPKLRLRKDLDAAIRYLQR